MKNYPQGAILFFDKQWGVICPTLIKTLTTLIYAQKHQVLRTQPECASPGKI